MPTDYVDDETIAQSCALLRRIRPEWIVPDKNTGDLRISSQGFKDPRMSIHLGDDLAAAGLGPNDVLKRYPEWDLAAITASTARLHQQSVSRQHVEEELYHGVVAGKKTQSTARAFANEATQNWLVRKLR